MVERSDAEVARTDLERDARVIDQTATMQATLRDWNVRTAFVLTVCAATASIVAVAFAFATDNASVSVLGISALRTTWIGWLSILAALLGIVDLIADRRGAARRRGEAVLLLASLKAEYRVALKGGVDASEVARLSNRYLDVATRVPEIPERLFNRLKSRHLLKVEVSKELSRNPGLSERQARKRVTTRVANLG